MEMYQVKSGDTLSKIAADVLGDGSRWPEIAKLNNIVDANRIFPGATLLLPEVQKLEPITIDVAKRGTRERKTTAGPDPDVQPDYAGIGFNLEPKTMMYLAAGALLLYLAMERK